MWELMVLMFDSMSFMKVALEAWTMTGSGLWASSGYPGLGNLKELMFDPRVK